MAFVDGFSSAIKATIILCDGEIAEPYFVVAFLMGVQTMSKNDYEHSHRSCVTIPRSLENYVNVAAANEILRRRNAAKLARAVLASTACEPCAHARECLRARCSVFQLLAAFASVKRKRGVDRYSMQEKLRCFR